MNSNRSHKYGMSPRKLYLFVLLLASLVFAAAGSGPAAGSGSAAVNAPSTSSSANLCPALPPPTGAIVNVSNTTALVNAVNSAAPGVTILLADGTYNMASDYLWIDTPNVTLRSASGNREAVILDSNYGGTETISIVASNVTIADLTIQRSPTHPIHVSSSDSGDTLNTLIYNVRIFDPGQQAIKINPHTAKIHFPDNGEIACSHIELTDAGRPRVWEINGSCYTGGVDAHQARGWTIRDNHIEGFWCPQDLSEHGIHLWTGSRDTIVERNVLVNNARGVGFGLNESGTGRTYSDNPCPTASGYVDHYGGIIRNNFVFVKRAELFSSEAGFDCGICLWQACGAQVLHNTVVSTQVPFSSIEWRFDNTLATLTNNIVSHNLRERGGSATLTSNLTSAPLSLFVDGANGDLHLAAGASTAIDQGAALASGLCDDDIDGDTRPTSGSDIGADERLAAPPPTPNYFLWLPITFTPPN